MSYREGMIRDIRDRRIRVVSNLEEKMDAASVNDASSVCSSASVLEPRVLTGVHTMGSFSLLASSSSFRLRTSSSLLMGSLASKQTKVFRSESDSAAPTTPTTVASTVASSSASVSSHKSLGSHGSHRSSKSHGSSRQGDSIVRELRRQLADMTRQRDDAMGRSNSALAELHALQQKISHGKLQYLQERIHGSGSSNGTGKTTRVDASSFQTAREEEKHGSSRSLPVASTSTSTTAAQQRQQQQRRVHVTSSRDVGSSRSVGSVGSNRSLGSQRSGKSDRPLPHVRNTEQSASTRSSVTFASNRSGPQSSIAARRGVSEPHLGVGPKPIRKNSGPNLPQSRRASESYVIKSARKITQDTTTTPTTIGLPKHRHWSPFRREKKYSKQSFSVKEDSELFGELETDIDDEIS
uniref:Uncharacterized protein n=1 Tax=Attheya septentrionalis TaxID=420275 RepID=A0A7S2UF10_9STRA|mmetsp:Transcript_22730/g.41087  ORF Transcript_22730/g.41087 Transcript_22730/m.41087 type:complete len:409 (+) Transcript_22730:138-1364(+)